MSVHLAHRGGFVALTALVVVLAHGPVAAQAVEPRVVEFLPAAGAVAHYDVEIAAAGTGQVLQRVAVGTPAVAADGMMRVNVAAQLTAVPAAGLPYVARVLAVGPLGTTVSHASNAFTFSRCQYTVTAPEGPLPTAGGRASVTVTASSGACSWSAVSAAPWLTIVDGAAGLGTGRVTVSASTNTSPAPRVATLAVGSLRATVTQAGAAPQTVVVSTEPELQAAIAALTSHTTILIAPGTYRLRATLRIAGPLAGVTVRGTTGRAADVVLEGAGTTVASAAPTALQVTGRVHALQIADLTIRAFAAHALRLDAGAQAPHLSNLRLADTGAALVLVAPGVDDGRVETSTFTAAADGLDLRGAARWIIAGNAFRDVRGVAVAAHAGSTDTVVTHNAFRNNAYGIALGRRDVVDGVDHRGGRISNNVVTRAATVAGGAGIAVVDSPDTVVTHNTVLTAQTAAPIVYRFADTTGLVVANNLVDGALEARDGAWAAEAGNVTTATPDLFVDAARGDLHLRPTAARAIDLGQPDLADATDRDGDARLDGRPDVGADEVSPDAR